MGRVKYTIIYLLVSMGLGLTIRYFVAPTEGVGMWILVGFVMMSLISLVGFCLLALREGIGGLRKMISKKKEPEEEDEEPQVFV